MAATTLAPKLKAQAIGWLHDRLSSGPVTASAIYADAAAAGHSTKTIRRAAIDVGVMKQPPGGGKGCRWQLPQHAGKPVEVEDHRACSRCGVVQPIESFARYSRSRGAGPSRRCQTCTRERKKAYEQAIAGGASSYERELSAAPDPAPAQRLREELAAARTTGVSFSETWPAAVDAALEDLEPAEQADWRRAFHELRSAWRAGYDRSEVPGGDLPSLLLMAA